MAEPVPEAAPEKGANGTVEKVWVVVRVRRGASSPDDASIHTGFTDAGPANLLCDILNDKNSKAPFEFRVLEMPRFRMKRHLAAS